MSQEPLIDRMIAPLGARRLVEGRQGMGWLLTEMAPVVMWSGVTGAMGLESVLLISYLGLLGCDDQMLALLPMLGFGGMLIALAVIYLQQGLSITTAQGHCFRFALWGRLLWLGTVLWPLLAWAFSAPDWMVWGGVLLVIASSQTLLWVGVTSFSMWTQAVIPLRLRGQFYSWRNTASFIVLSLTLFLVGMLMPSGGQVADPQATLQSLMLIFAVTTFLGVLAAWPLAWSPAAPAHTQEQVSGPRRPLGQVLREHSALRRFLAFGILNAASNAIFLTYMARYLFDLAIGEDTVAFWQGILQMPFMLLGIWLSGYLLPRLGGARMLGLTQCSLMAVQASFLALHAANQVWLLPLLFIGWGLTRSAQRLITFGRLQEVMSAGDPRQPSLYFGLMGLGSILGAAGVMFAVPYLEAARASQYLALPVSWYIMAAAIVLGIFSSLIAIIPQPEHRPYDPEDGIIPAPNGPQGMRP